MTTPKAAASEHWGDTSSASLCALGGSSLTLWSSGDTADGKAEGEVTTQLHPDRPAVIGRQEGGETPYLDPRYRPTQIVSPSSGSVLAGGEPDRWVSRGHFMLRASPCGVLLVNGVPRRGGGIRPPLNGTWLVAPVRRLLGGGEEYLIGWGESATIRLPNGATIRINAR